MGEASHPGPADSVNAVEACGWEADSSSFSVTIAACKKGQQRWRARSLLALTEARGWETERDHLHRGDHDVRNGAAV